MKNSSVSGRWKRNYNSKRGGLKKMGIHQKIEQGKYPALPDDKRSQPFQPHGGVAGHDGHPPEKVGARDIESRDPLTGRMKRETPEGPQNVNCDRIEWLFAHHKIGRRQYDAANRLMQDNYIAGRETIATSGASHGGFCDFTPGEQREIASRRFAAAEKMFAGWRREHWVIIELVVLKGLTIEKAGATARIDHRVAQERLRVALNELADHYRFEDA